jgi:hypothetical protein
MALLHRQTDRKTPAATPGSFEDRLWPIYVLIGILSASAVGIVLAYSEFPAWGTFAWTDAAILSSGWFRLTSVAVFVAVAVGAVHLARRWMNRRMLFCVLFGMLLHLWGAMYLHDQILLLRARLNSSREDELVELPDPVTVPDYHWEAIERAEVRQSFEKPVPTTAADEGRVEPVERQPMEYETRLEIPAPAPRQPADNQVPRPRDLALADRPAPSETDELTRMQFDRQHFIDRPAPSETLPLPEVPTRPKAESPRLDVPLEPIERRQRSAAIPDRPPVQTEMSPAGPHGETTPLRRASESAPILVESAIAGIPRSFPETTMVPRTNLEVPEIITTELQPPSMEIDFEPGITERRQSDPRVHGATPTAPVSSPGRSTPPMIASRRTGSQPALATSAGSLSIRRAETGLPSMPMTRPAGRMNRETPQAGNRNASGKKTGDLASISEDRFADAGGGPIARVQRLDFAASVWRPGVKDSGDGSGADAGISRRPRRGESQVAVANSTRLAIPRGDARPVIRSRAVIAAPGPFGQRDPRRRLREALNHGGTPATELAVELGLEYFARNQSAAGHWSLDRPPEPNPNAAAGGLMSADTAATGLALLSFLGAGYTHQEGKYRDTVGRGLGWLQANQHSDGRLYDATTDRDEFARMYGHGIAAIAICEAYGMTRDEELLLAAESAVSFILAAQNPARGGWRYLPGQESDTSVSGWQLMALKSARMAGLDVPAEAWEKVSHWLDTARSAGGSQYVYNPHASDNEAQRLGRLPSLAMTAEGLLMRFYLGWDGEHPAAIAGADYLGENLPQLGTADRPLRDTYYWYYATQVMFQMQGDRWKAWNERMRHMLVEGQELEGPLAGSWDPWSPLPDRWASAGGRHYITALNLLMLEVYYRHLPLFRTLGEGD